MTALEFANTHDHVVVRIAGVGCPAGMDIALLSETELPFNLEDIEGFSEDGFFEATNLCTGGKDGWWVHDWKANIIYSVWLRIDDEEWQKQYNDYFHS